MSKARRTASTDHQTNKLQRAWERRVENRENRNLPLALVVPIASGSDPDVMEIVDVEDRSVPSQVYGDDEIHLMFPEVDTPCENPDAPCGQCHFNAASLEPDRCLYCGKRTG